VSSERLFLFLVGLCMGIVAWQTFTYPPTYLAASWVWAGMAGGAALSSVVASVSPFRGAGVVAGATLICHAIGRAGGITLQLVFRDTVGLGAPFANYAVAAATWSLVALLAFHAWVRFVLPWCALRKG
jgi:hypothetical protein